MTCGFLINCTGSKGAPAIPAPKAPPPPADIFFSIAETPHTHDHEEMTSSLIYSLYRVIVPYNIIFFLDNKWTYKNNKCTVFVTLSGYNDYIDIFIVFKRKKLRQQKLMTYYAYCTIRQKERLLLRYESYFCPFSVIKCHTRHQ